jgi:hypothetical protein
LRTRFHVVKATAFVLQRGRIEAVALVRDFERHTVIGQPQADRAVLRVGMAAGIAHGFAGDL